MFLGKVDLPCFGRMPRCQKQLGTYLFEVNASSIELFYLAIIGFVT